MKKRTKIIVYSLASVMVLTLVINYYMRSRLSEPTLFFLPGVYACRTGNEFCKIEDTIMIRRMELGGASYSVTHHSAFTRVKQGKNDLPECQKDQWVGVFDPVHQILTAPGRSDTILYLPERNKIYRTEFIYEKVE